MRDLLNPLSLVAALAILITYVLTLTLIIPPLINYMY